MTTETSNARGWVLVPRVPTEAMLDSAENAMIESEWAYNAGDPDARSDAHGFPTMRIWQAVVAYRAMLAAAPPPSAAQSAEIEALRAEAARLRRSLHEAVVHGNRQSGRAERLAEALRHQRWCRTCAEDGWESCEEGRKNDALLRDQE